MSANLDLGNYLTDGAFIDIIPSSPLQAVGPQTGLIAIVGTATDGVPNQPTVFLDQPSLFAEFGMGTTLPYSLVREALTAMCYPIAPPTFIGVRVTDGTDTAATIVLKDTQESPATVITLTRKNTGSRANGATAYFVLVSGTTSENPVYRLIITYPNQPAEVYNNLVAYAGGGGAYSAAVLQANALAAINVGSLTSAPSPRWTATAGSSVNAPSTAVAQASGGTDGASGVGTAQLLGTSAYSGSTGMYALTGLVTGAQVILAALTDPTAGPTIAEFCEDQQCLGWLAFPSLTPTETAIGTRATNDLASPYLLLASDWLYVNDTISGQTLLVSPMGALAAIVASVQAYQYPGNQPTPGVTGILRTDRITNGMNSVTGPEAGERQQNGILYLSYMPQQLRGPKLGLPHGMTSDGVTRICDTRMLCVIADELQSILGAIVGQAMNTKPGPNLGQPALGNAQDAADAYLNGLAEGSPAQISDYEFLFGSNNTQGTVQKGYLLPAILVTTLAAAQFIVTALQVGSSVQITVQSAN